jgi:hypothetical protein
LTMKCTSNSQLDSASDNSIVVIELSTLDRSLSG